MKKLLIFTVAAFLLISCSKNKAQNQNEGPIVLDMPELPSQEKLKESNKDISINSAKVDLDLTKMSATMIYSEVFNMLIEPDYYENKIIKIKGNFNVFTDENTGENYFAILIPDATACCQQGIEFVWPGDHLYPQDYPEVNQEITIVGQYKVEYTPDGLQYCYLAISELTIQED
ncbi:MAG: hypothetical protein K5866_10165 [Treponema sp.]|nr:hypothetical protein [Treponema sp.]